MKKKCLGEQLPDRSASRILALSLMNQALHSNHNGRRPNDSESALLQPHPTTTFEFHIYIIMACRLHVIVFKVNIDLRFS